MTPEERATERRLSGRIEEILTGWWRSEGSKFQRCKTLDLAMDGALIVLDQELSDGEEFELHLDMESNWSVAFNAKILWQRPIFFGKQYLTAVSYRFQKSSDQSMFGLWIRRKIHEQSGHSEHILAPVILSKPKPELEPLIEPAPKVYILESPWKKTLSQLTAMIPWFESDPLPNERRAESRGQVGLRVRCETEAEIFGAEFLNISLSGVGLFVPKPKSKSAETSGPSSFQKGERMELLVPENSLLLGGRRCRAEVVWCHQADMEGPLSTEGMAIGLKFAQSPQQTKKTFVGDLLRRIDYKVRQVRAELRFPRELPVIVEIKGFETVKGTSVDISAGGAHLMIPTVIPTPCNAKVHLDLGSGGGLVNQLSLSARLLRRTVDKVGRNCYAVAFRKGQARERLELSRWLASQLRVQDLEELIPNFSKTSGGESS